MALLISLFSNKRTHYSCSISRTVEVNKDIVSHLLLHLKRLLFKVVSGLLYYGFEVITVEY